MSQDKTKFSSNTSEVIPVITVDGPGGSGKGTVSVRLAGFLGWHFLDSGALYRMIALMALEQNVDLDDAETLARLAPGSQPDFKPGEDGGARVFLDNREITDNLRQEDVAAVASRIAALGPVRQALLEKQRAYRQPPGLVADGRDMGSTVFPEARVKIFLTASPEERAQRRYKQLKLKGSDVNLARLTEDIQRRDQRDAQRPISPLRPAEGATVLDTTEMEIEQVVQTILEIWQKTQ